MASDEARPAERGPEVVEAESHAERALSKEDTARNAVVPTSQIMPDPTAEAVAHVRPSPVPMACDAPDLPGIWAAVMRESAKKPAIELLVAKMRLVEVGETRVILHAPPDVAALAGKAAAGPLGEIFSRLLNKQVTIAVVPVAGSTPPAATGPATASAPAAQPAARGNVPVAGVRPSPGRAEPPGDPMHAEHPLVKKAMALFDARVVKIVAGKGEPAKAAASGGTPAGTAPIAGTDDDDPAAA